MTTPSDAIIRIDGGSSTLWGRYDRAAWDVRIDVGDDELQDDTLDEAEWARRCEANPRLFNGPMLSVDRFDPEAGTVRARRAWYKQLVLDSPGIQLLAVIGVVVARREGGGVCTLMGRRGRQTRLYGRRWELAPAGGVDPIEGPSVTRDMVMAQLAEEMREEVGIEAQARHADIVAMVHNQESRSLDLVALIEPEETVEALRARAFREATWEYERLLWLPIRAASRFVATHGEQLTPQSRVIFEYLGWA